MQVINCRSHEESHSGDINITTTTKSKQSSWVFSKQNLCSHSGRPSVSKHLNIFVSVCSQQSQPVTMILHSGTMGKIREKSFQFTKILKYLRVQCTQGLLSGFTPPFFMRICAHMKLVIKSLS